MLVTEVYKCVCADFLLDKHKTTNYISCVACYYIYMAIDLIQQNQHADTRPNSAASVMLNATLPEYSLMCIV